MQKVVLLLALFVALAFARVQIDDLVIRDLGLKNGKADILIMMKNEGDLESLTNSKEQSLDQLDWIELGRVVTSHKMEIATSQQAEIVSILKSKNFKFTPYWVANCIAVYDASESLVHEISKRSDVRLIGSNAQFNVPILPEETADESAKDMNQNNTQVEWNVKWVKADKVWAMGHEGKGIVVGNADTGHMYNHKALVGSYRGNLGNGEFDHNYNWFDGLREFPTCGRCPCKGKVPCDDQGHGTHCIGTTAGGVDRKIGVAPAAKWIGCRAFSDAARRASPATFLNCLQFFAAPTDLDGKDPDSDLRPHSTSHSYGCPNVFCPNPEFLKEAAETLKRSGQFMIVSSGNSGPGCSTINRPPGHMASIVSVGASNTNANTIASFSSRGPITLDRSNRMKPDITAPGVNVWSATATGGYASYSGTSMASPAVNGVVALIWDAVPELIRKVDETLKIILESAVKMPVTNTCSSNGTPNNVYGHGIIDAEAAVTLAKKLYRK
jgi:hypothetical protein